MIHRISIQLLRMRGAWRLYWGSCPGCNLDAPDLYDCNICEFYGIRPDEKTSCGSPVWPVSKHKLERWRVRFAEALSRGC